MRIDQFDVEVGQDEDGIYLASVPVLPGCHTQGQTMEELEFMVKDIINLCMKIASEDEEYRRQIKERAKKLGLEEPETKMLV